MGYHTPGKVVFKKTIVISELHILYRLEKMGSVTKNGDNYKKIRHKWKMYIIPLFYLYGAIVWYATCRN